MVLGIQHMYCPAQKHLSDGQSLNLLQVQNTQDVQEVLPAIVTATEEPPQSQELIQNTKDALQQHFKIEDLGELRYFLGIELARNKIGIVMHQRKYALELISDMGLAGSKTLGAPIELNLKLTYAEYDQHLGQLADCLMPDPSCYHRLIGRLFYLTITLPDIAFVVQCLGQFMQAPKVSHMEAARKVVRYVIQELGLGIFLSATGSDKLIAYCDADWVSCPNTMRSVTGYIVKFGDSLISWKSKKQTTISRSSAEAEYMSLASTMAEVIRIIGLFKELSIDLQLPVSLFCDSKSAIQIAANHEKVQQGLVATLYLSSAKQQADMLNKSLTKAQYSYLVSKLGMKSSFLMA
ncbi:uncharacterized mitochondrial protein AtMg00810-like [Nicotiana sylvestris]|uniref:uncharacterized mitochondrial protein AtMg00810-like n=1 Tax=Nicotiana sylvestris TaxID=4096 RepID=UPI00388CBD72